VIRPGQVYWNGNKRILATVYHVRTGTLVTEATIGRNGFTLRYRKWSGVPKGFVLHREPRKR
jgi:hypothetical protein